MHFIRTFLAVNCLNLALASPGTAQDRSLDNLAQELISLRSEVESRHSELERKRENYRTELRALASQKAELDASRRREELSVQQLQESLEKRRQQVREAGTAGEELEPVLMRALADLRDHVQGGMPFKRAERAEAVASIERQVRSSAINPQRAVNRLWSAYEDELRLTRENAIHSQVIELEGSEVLVDVARLGMVLMYFRTRDERYGYAVPGAGGWEFRRVEDDADIRRIRDLFDSLRKQIRTGYFPLPIPGLPGEVN